MSWLWEVYTIDPQLVMSAFLLVDQSFPAASFRTLISRLMLGLTVNQLSFKILTNHNLYLLLSCSTDQDKGFLLEDITFTTLT